MMMSGITKKNQHFINCHFFGDTMAVDRLNKEYIDQKANVKGTLEICDL